MKSNFDLLSRRVSLITTRAYSTSFSLGIYFLNKRLRHSIYAIYGFVRLADEIVDSFNEYNRRELLNQLRAETYAAIQNGISLNPILNSFQETVRAYKIDRDLIDTFLASMEMDLQDLEYDVETYERYILGSAEVVGLMCLRVFVEKDAELYDRLKPFAMKLGAAFQKVNFLRDLKDDQVILGRNYFPGLSSEQFNLETKLRIEAEITRDFEEALLGIRMLPASSKGGVYLAFVYYRSLFNKIRKLPAQKILQSRIRINNGQKFGLMINSLLQHKFNWI